MLEVIIGKLSKGLQALPIAKGITELKTSGFPLNPNDLHRY